MTNYTRIIVIVSVTIIASAAVYYILKNCNKSNASIVGIKEHYDPQDMGGRKYFGFGREYGYPQRDMDNPQNVCYQISSRHLCREGYSRRINTITMSDECCVNNFVYQ